MKIIITLLAAAIWTNELAPKLRAATFAALQTLTFFSKVLFRSLQYGLQNEIIVLTFISFEHFSMHGFTYLVT